MIVEKLGNSVRQALEKLSISDVGEIHFEHPAEISHGDFSTNIALKLGKKLGENPRELAEQITEHILQDKPEEIEKVESAGAGFINFFLSKEFFVKATANVLKEKENWGKNTNLKGQKIMVEYTDPNPFKQFHIGHLMSNAIGESVSRLLEFSGAIVKRANYQGDVGLHIATAIWGKLEKPELSWGEAYAYGSKNYDSNKKEIEDLNKKIYEKSDQKINKLYEDGRQESLDHFEEIYKKLGTKFDYSFFESKEGVKGKPIVEAHLNDGVFEKSDGAAVFRGEKYSLHTRVFINSQGQPTYEAKELGLNKEKFEVEPDLDRSIIITGNEIKEYFKVLLKVMSLIFPEIAKKTVHLPHGMLRLPSGKMSSRTGDVITAESLIEQVKERIKERLVDREFSDNEKQEIAEVVSLGAIKYSILRQSVGGDIIFDFDKSISFEGDSGPYLQYTAVRAKSVLGKAKQEKIKPAVKSESKKVNEVERLLYRFPEIVEKATKEYSPHYIATFLVELAGVFNSFYAKEKILDKEDKNSPYKIALTEATLLTLENGLWILGIKVPERM